jgi:hypothetical protein
MLAALLVAVFVGFLSGTGPSVGGFAGTWERDPDRSDDGEAKMREAFARMQAEMERRGGGIPGGPPPGGGGPAGGAGERRARPGQVPDELYIEHDQGELRVDDGERLQIFYLDGQKHRRQLPNGEKLETVATLQRNVVLIDEKMKRGKIQRKLELLDDGKTIVWTLVVDLDRMKEPVQIRTVYERVEE